MSHLTSRNTAVGVNDLKIHPKLPIKLTEDMKNRTVPKQELRTPPWLHFIGGGMGGLVGSVLLCPLEVVKTGLQSSLRTGVEFRPKYPTASFTPLRHFTDVLAILRLVYRLEGKRGLFKGLGANLVGVIPARAINFTAYGNGKALLKEWNNGVENSWIHLVSAASAGLVTATATNPIWLVKTRMQLPDSQLHYRSSWHCALKVLREEGLRGLYKGLSASYLGVAEGTIQWVTYEKMKRYFAERRLGESSNKNNSNEGTWSEFWISATIAKFLAAIITYPHEVVRTRLREVSSNPSQRYKYTGIIQTVRLVAREEGLAALYGGLSAHLLRVVPNAGIMFFCYEAVLYFGTRFCNPPQQQQQQK